MNGRARARVVLVSLVSLVALAGLHCGHATREVGHRLSDRAQARLANAPVTYAPVASEPPSPEAAAIDETFRAALSPFARENLRHEPALDRVAATAAEHYSDTGERPSHALMQWLFWKAGSTDVYRSFHGGWSSGRTSTRRSIGGDADQLKLDHWARTAAEFVQSLPSMRLAYGIARFTEAKTVSQAVVFGWSFFDVPSFPKAYPPGAPVIITLAPRSPLAGIRALLDRGDTVEDHAVVPRPDGAFQITLTAPPAPGRYFVEVQDAGSRATLLLFPIFVGAADPTAPDEFIQSPPAAPPSASGWSEWLAARVAGERARLGRQPITIDPSLAALAVERSLGIARRDSTARDAAASYGAVVQRFGQASSSLLEVGLNVDGPDTVLLNLLRPSIRRRLVLEDHVSLGVGATPNPGNPELQAPTITLVEESVVDTPR
jgi:hypothetical protein